MGTKPIDLLAWRYGAKAAVRSSIVVRVIIFVDFLTVQKYDNFTRSLRRMCAFFQIRSNRSSNLLAAPLATVHKHKKPTAAYCSRALSEGDSALCFVACR